MASEPFPCSEGASTAKMAVMDQRGGVPGGTETIFRKTMPGQCLRMKRSFPSPSRRGETKWSGGNAVRADGSLCLPTIREGMAHTQHPAAGRSQARASKPARLAWRARLEHCFLDRQSRFGVTARRLERPA